jgi:hypothetical protein
MLLVVLERIEPEAVTSIKGALEKERAQFSHNESSPKTACTKAKLTTAKNGSVLSHPPGIQSIRQAPAGSDRHCSNTL